MQISLVKRLLALGAGTLITLPLNEISAQAGDKRDPEGHVQEEIWKNVDVPPAPILTPEEAMKTFHVEPGYSLELVAAEPLVNDPVAIAWDENGRLWAAEMWAYMPDVDGVGEHEPVSRVVILEDDDGDGQMDRSTVFLDGLVLPRAIAIVKGGALIADPPNLYFCEDTDGDLVADKKTVVAEYASTGNVEHAENGLLRGIDNWYYNAKSDRRLKFEDGRIQEDATNFRGQWGITQDDYGRLYYNSNSFYLYGDMIPWEGVSKHPGRLPQKGIQEPVAPDRTVHTARINTGVNRGYLDGTLSPDYRLRAVTAVSAPAISRGNRYPPEARGGVFVPEPAGNVVSRFELQEENLIVSAEKKLHTHEQWGPVEFISSTDERFRPVAAATGPDGFIYVVDMYRGILQHKTYLTSFLRKQIIERGLDKPVGLGRIYRVVHENDSQSREVPKLEGLSQIKLVPYLASENGWTRDTAQRLILESGSDSKKLTNELKRMTSLGSERTRIHALWTLHGLQEIDLDTLQTAYQKGNDWIRVHALRTASESLALARKTNHPFWQSYLSALSNWPTRVRLQAVSLLPFADSPEFELQAIFSLNTNDLDDPFFIDAAVSNLHGQEVALLKLASSSEAPETFATLVAALTQAVFDEGNSKAAASYAQFFLSDSADPQLKAAIETGFTASLTDQNVRPLELSAPLPIEPEIGSTVFKAFTWPGKQDPDAIVEYQYSDDDLASISRGQPLYINTCAVCHNVNGLGTPSLAPAVAGSKWVTDSKERLALVVGQGLSGPIEVKDELWNQAMPPHAQHPALSGENFNDLLNYMRASWGNNASPYEPGEARSYLQKHSDRTEPWITEEFEDLGLAD